MPRRLVEVEHRCKAHVQVTQQPGPRVARLLPEPGGQHLLGLRPLRAIHLVLQQRVVCELQALEQLAVELGLDGRHGDVFAIGAFVDLVEVRTRVEQVGAALAGEHACGVQSQCHRHQRGHAVHHGGIDHLSPAGAARLQDAGQQSEGQIHRAARVVAQDVERHGGRQSLAAHGIQRAGDGDVVQVVPGHLRQRALLPPAGHAAIDQPRVARQARVGTEAQALHHPRAKAFDQRIGLIDQFEHHLHRGRVLQIHTDGLAVAQPQVEAHRPRRAQARRLPAIHPDDVGAQVGQEHGGQRTRADAGDLHDLDARQGAGACRHGQITRSARSFDRSSSPSFRSRR